MKPLIILCLLLFYNGSFAQNNASKQQPLLYLKINTDSISKEIERGFKKMADLEKYPLITTEEEFKSNYKKLIAGGVGNNLEGEAFANFSANNTLLWAVSISYKTTNTNPTQPVSILKYKLVPLPPKADVAIQEVEISATTIYKNGFTNFIEQLAKEIIQTIKQ